MHGKLNLTFTRPLNPEEEKIVNSQEDTVTLFGREYVMVEITYRTSSYESDTVTVTLQRVMIGELLVDKDKQLK